MAGATLGDMLVSMAQSRRQHFMYLVPLAGPDIPSYELAPTGGTMTIGRSPACELSLPSDAESVSRTHARLRFDGRHWLLSDVGSRWGTFLNGVKLSVDREMVLTEGDLIRITPWTFSFTATRDSQTASDSVDDVQQMSGSVRTIVQENDRGLAQDLLSLLLESADRIHGAADERALAEMILDVACRGTGFSHAAMLRPTDSMGKIEVLATRSATGLPPGKALYSRSLLRTAANGVVAEFTSADAENFSQSIMEMQISSALCVPLMLGKTVAAYLYLDSRGGSTQHLRNNASSFCLALGRIASLALANLKRIDIERRQASMESELAAGAEAQRWIMPQRKVQFGRFSCLGESRPGRFVGGDFFDLMPLSDTKLIVTLGDVTGKGVAASVLMTATQGFLHAMLSKEGNPAAAVNALNHYVSPRRPDTKFVTLWIGLIDTEKNTLTYVDAGHGYGTMAAPDGRFLVLTSEEGPPVGIEPDMEYHAMTVPLIPGGALLVVSDGIIEQNSPTPDITGTKPCFELDNVKKSIIHSLTTRVTDPVAALFEAVIHHAGSTSLGDDATAVLVQWDAPDTGTRASSVTATRI